MGFIHGAAGPRLFASGQYTAQEVLDQINAAGLRTRGDRSHSPKPLSLSQFYLILSDRYYCGFVTYDDQEYPGRHQALITEETYERVQRVLALRGGGGTRERHHHHWLKGLLWCHRCGHRMLIARGQRQRRHLLLLLLSQSTKAPLRPAVPQRRQATVRDQLDDTLLLEQGHISAFKKRLGARLDELDTKEDGLLDLLDDPEWPRQKIKKQLAEIEQERTQVQAQLADTTSRLEEGQQFFAAALALLSAPQGFYRHGSDGVKRAMTKIIFSKLHVDAEIIAGHDLTDGMVGLIKVGTRAVTNDKSSPLPEGRNRS